MDVPSYTVLTRLIYLSLSAILDNASPKTARICEVKVGSMIIPIYKIPRKGGQTGVPLPGELQEAQRQVG